MSGVWKMVDPGAQLLPAVSRRRSGGREAGPAEPACAALRVRRPVVRAADLRRADRRADPPPRPVDRAVAGHACLGRPGAGRAGRCPAGRSVRGVGEPEHGAAAGRGTSRSAAAGPASGGRRRVRDAQGPHLRDGGGRRRNPPTGGPAARPGGIEPGGLAGRASRSSAATARRSSPRAPLPGRRRPSRSRTAGTYGTTSAKRPSAPSPATDSA